MEPSLMLASHPHATTSTSSKPKKTTNRQRRVHTEGAAEGQDYFLAGRPAIARVIAADLKWRQAEHSLQWIHPETKRKVLNIGNVWDLDTVPAESTIYIYLFAEEAVATPDAIKQLRKALGAHRAAGGRVEYVG